MGSLLSRVSTTAQSLPSRVFLYAREKWGKSSLFAHAPGAIFFMTRGETGLVELIAGNRVPPTAHFPYDEQQPPTWSTLRQAIRELRDEDHPYRFFVVDTANGAEILCQDHVRASVFRGSQAKFAAFGKGWDECRVEWLGLLQDLDALRAKRRMAVVLLAHTQVKKFDDPTAEESYDKYKPACADKLWDLTHKWADIICFGHFKAQTFETDSGKVKARNEVRRVLCFDQSPLWEAGNRYGIAGELEVGGGAKQAFAKFADLVGKAKAAVLNNTQKTPPVLPQTHAQEPAKPAAQSAPQPADEEGEQRADFTPAATTSTTTAAPSPTPSTAPATEPEPRPSRAEVENARARMLGMKTHEARVAVWGRLPAAVRAEIPEHEPKESPKSPAAGAAMAGGNIVKVIVDLLHKLGLNWGSVRDGIGKGGTIAEAAGLPKLPLDFRVGDLTAAEAMRLRDELQAAAKEQEARAEKRAANKAAKQEVGAAS